MTHARTSSICASVLLAASAALVPGTSASAKEPVVITAPIDTVVRHIGYADLNLASQEGARTLNNRVEYGVRDLCGEASGGNDGSFTYKQYTARCHRVSWDQARPQMDLAMQRAREIAATGTSSIAAAALVISVPR